MKKIIRISRAHFDPATADEVEKVLLEERARIWPEQEKLPGFIDGYLGVDRRNGSMIWVTFWDSVDHANALGTLPQMASSNARFRARGLTFDPISTHEIV